MNKILEDPLSLIDQLIGDLEKEFLICAQELCKQLNARKASAQTEATLKAELSDIEHVFDRLTVMEKKFADRKRQDECTPTIDFERARQDILERLSRKRNGTGD